MSSTKALAIGMVVLTNFEFPHTQVLNDSDCDSSDSSETDLRAAIAAGRGVPGSKSLSALLRSAGAASAAGGVPPTMTSLQTMASQFAAMASLQGIQPGLAQFYNRKSFHR